MQWKKKQKQKDPVPEEPVPSYDLLGDFTCSTHIHADKTSTLTIIIINTSSIILLYNLEGGGEWRAAAPSENA